MKPNVLLLSLLLGSIPGHPTDSPDRPDVIVMTTHPVHFTVSIDPGPLAPCLCRSYLVAAGDTIDRIAERECGDLRCSEEIRLLNPAVDPRRMMPGSRIVIPPRAIRADSRGTARANEDARAAEWVVLQCLGGEVLGKPRVAPVVESQQLAAFRTQSWLIAVPREKLVWFLRGRAQDGDLTTPPDGVVCSDPIPARLEAPIDDPVRRIDTRLGLTGIEDGRLRYELTEKRYDVQGKLIAEGREQAVVMASRSGDLAVPLLILAAGALVGVIALVARRRGLLGPA